MSKYLKVIYFVAILIVSIENVSAVNYYFNPVSGNDQNIGLSAQLPLKNLAMTKSLKLNAGDSILLAKGTTFYGTLVLQSVTGSLNRPVVVSTYGYGTAKAIIDASNFLNGVLLENCSFVNLQNVRIRANGGTTSGSPSGKAEMRCGVLVAISQEGNYSKIHLKGLYVSDVFYENVGFVRNKNEVKTANGSQNYGWGIRFINQVKGSLLSDVKVESCVVKNVEHTGIKFTTYHGGITNVLLKNDSVMYTGGPGIQMSGVKEGLVEDNYVFHSGSADDSRKWGRGSGLWTWDASDILIQRNNFLYANGPGDSAGCHIDFNCRDVVVQYNFSAHNAGGFCEILGNNYNCAYRYNISVDDGYRVKGENGAFQEGKLFWLSGYVGDHKPKNGPYNTYFYNNTMYVSKNIVPKIAIANSAAGVLIMNNIFCLEGEAASVSDDQNKNVGTSLDNKNRVVFKNNLFLSRLSWPKEELIKDSIPLFGNPGFARSKGLSSVDYVPRNRRLVQGKGLEIPRIPGDSIGLRIGLKVGKDILGHSIVGKSDIGAIKLP